MGFQTKNDLQRFALTENPDKSVKVLPSGTFTDLSVLVKASIGCSDL